VTTSRGGITPAEAEVALKLAEAWDLFLALPIEHADDVEEFRRAIHSAQAQVLMRPGRRQLNDPGR
jgi:hypothetical protein